MLLDVSIDLNNKTQVYPGDPAMEIEPLATVGPDGGHCLNRLHMTVHTGTHLDAPAHYIEGGKTIDQIPLSRFYGDCQVVDLTDCDGFDENILDRRVDPNAERVLFKTVDPARPQRRFADMTASIAEYLVQLGIMLVGIDRMSIENSEEMTCHKILLGADRVLLECLDLSRAQGQKYQLWCLPLKLTGVEGAPCRAILRNGHF